MRGEKGRSCMVVFQCGSEPDDIYCAVYDAWMSRLGHANVCIEEAGADPRLFCEYRTVVSEVWKTEKVVTAIRRKLSEDVYELTYRAALSNDAGRADKIYRFLIAAFAYGAGILNHLGYPPVHAVFSLSRYMAREAHHYIEFVRFSQMKGGILLGKIEPKCNVLPVIAPHFCDRLPSENWILYDCRRKRAAVHRADGEWLILQADSEEWQHRLQEETDESVFENLWRTFHSSIAIEARANYQCQRNMLPLRFRPHMLEFF